MADQSARPDTLTNGTNPAKLTNLDRRMLASVIAWGAAGVGRTWPNPSVGALVVRDRLVVARGRTGAGGRPHGETVALDRAGDMATGSTLYVSLEPCAHQGKTPPCVDAIIAAQVRRVVIGAGDPDPRVNGRGIAALEAAGITVAMADDLGPALAANAGYVRRTVTGRPRIVLKLAVSADDAIGRQGAGNVAITGAIARLHVQAMRTRFDGILVGTGTALSDDPRLTCRLPGLVHRSPIRLVAGDFSKIPASACLLADDGPPTWFLTTTDTPAPGPQPRYRVIRAGDAGSAVDWQQALQVLGDEGMTSILVEGGARVARSLLEADLVDEVLLFRGAEIVGDGAVPALAGLPMRHIEQSPDFTAGERRWFGADRLTRYLRVQNAV
ncbi:MAG: bifunctional diaminohydroxyphosphoribosylaminopyrimidine deaminase/5-amino-6-(5-phosphoribosylamino)uracil reductase RibD [Alphaproteobacteria bacterium]